MRPFANEPLSNFADAKVAQRQVQALAEVRAAADAQYDLVIGGARVRAPAVFESRNPAEPDEVLGVFARADAAAALRALDAAERAFPAWARTAPAARAVVLFQAAELMRRRRFTLNAWLILEAGKNWVEADADTAEAIDFLEYYGREMHRYAAPPPLVAVPGEDNRLSYEPLGVGVVIPPWNFPNAILCGMTAAAVVAGNTVVLKPASDTPGTAWQVYRVFEDAGLPPGVLNFLTGPGAVAGETLVEHPRTRFIAFTGSKDVGLAIVERAGRTPPGQRWIKRVVAEMGGKDSILVAADADLEAAVEGVCVSAFGYQGQKCSACSRAIVEAQVYDEFRDRLVACTEQIIIGPPEKQGNWLGPVINEAALKKHLEYIEIGKAEGTLLTGGRRRDRPGFFLEPALFDGIGPKARLAQEEIFGPVLALIRCASFEEGVEIFNNTEYGLTGGLYTNIEARLQAARQELFVGNLYLNRKCTGALVGAHPFGGFNMSGTNSKAGGPDYLGLFLQAKVVARKV